MKERSNFIVDIIHEFIFITKLKILRKTSKYNVYNMSRKNNVFHDTFVPNLTFYDRSLIRKKLSLEMIKKMSKWEQCSKKKLFES